MPYRSLSKSTRALNTPQAFLALYIFDHGSYKVSHTSPYFAYLRNRDNRFTVSEKLALLLAHLIHTQSMLHNLSVNLQTLDHFTAAHIRGESTASHARRATLAPRDHASPPKESR